MSPRWVIGALVVANLRKIVATAMESGSWQITGGYPRMEDELAHAMAHESDWSGKKASQYEGVNVAAFALTETRGGEEVFGAFNVGGKSEWARTEKTMESFFGSADLPTEYTPVTKQEGRKKDVHIHAEVKLADTGSLEFGTYIGISKECCLCCAAALLVQGKYRFGGCHGEAFNHWPWPSFIRNDAGNLKRFMGDEAWGLYSKLTAGKKIGLAEPDSYRGDFLDWLEHAWGTLA